MISPVIGRPGIQTGTSVTYRQVFKAPESVQYLPGGGTFDGTKSRDAGSDNVLCLRAGLMMGQATSGKKWSPSVLGVSITNPLTGTGTSLTVSAATATELVRRIGTSGTFKLTGPPSANGTARTLTVTYSAVNTTTGVITLTALGVNQVEQINFNLASTAGNLQLTIQKPDGTFATTGNIAWNATDATYIAAMNTALDTASGVVGGIVASAIPATDTDLGLRLTYSGTGYAGLPWTRAQVALFPTTSTVAVYTPITTPVNGAFVVGSFVQPTDGAEQPKSVIGDGSGILLSANNVDVDFPQIAYRALVASAQIINWPTDTGLQAWVRSQFVTPGVRFEFDDLSLPL